MIYVAPVLIYAEWFRELITGVINSFKHGVQVRSNEKIFLNFAECNLSILCLNNKVQ